MTIDNKKAKMKNKRLRSKYSWVKSEEEHTNDCCAEGNRDMRSSELWRKLMESQGIYSGYGPGQEEPKEQGGPISTNVDDNANIFETPEDLGVNDDGEDVEVSNSDPKDPNSKKLFRKLLEKTHPDKTKSNDNVEDFFRAREAYENNNLAELVALCMKYNIDVPEYLLEAENLSLVRSIKETEHNISKMQNTLGYLWFMASNDEEKQRLLDLVLQQYGNQA
jgi:hypothetical protein